MGSSAPWSQSGARALSILLLSYFPGYSPDLYCWSQVPWNTSIPGFWRGNTEPQPGKAACLQLEMTLELHISLLLTFHCPILGHAVISTCRRGWGASLWVHLCSGRSEWIWGRGNEVFRERTTDLGDTANNPHLWGNLSCHLRSFPSWSGMGYFPGPQSCHCQESLIPTKVSSFIHRNRRKTRRIQALTERVMECHLLVCLSALMVIVKIFSDLICEIVVCLKYLWFIIIDYSFCCFIYFLFFGYATKHIESHLSDQGLNPGSQVLVAQSCPTLCNSIDCIFGEDIFY